MSDIFQQSDCEQLYEKTIKWDIDAVKKQLIMQYENKWVEEINHKPKWRTFCLIKGEFVCERYIMNNLDISKRSPCAQVSETSRCNGEMEKKRLYNYCNLEEIENGINLILYWPFYHNICLSLLQKAHQINPEMMWLSHEEKRTSFFVHCAILFADFF